MGTFPPFWGGGRWNEVLEFVGSRFNKLEGGVGSEWCVFGGKGGGV